MSRPYIECILLSCFLFLFVNRGEASAPSKSLESGVLELVQNIRPTDRVGVTKVYERTSGDITELGNLLRDRIEAALSREGVRVVPRLDLWPLEEDMANFGRNSSLGQVLDRAEATVVILGKYHIVKSEETPERDTIVLHLKAWRIPDPSAIGSVEVRESLEPGWVRLESRVFGNYHQSRLEGLTPGHSRGPHLTACLNRNPACYPPAAEASMTIETGPGVHIYIMNLQADGTVIILYPNRLLPDRPLPDGRLSFPPAAMGDKMRLELHPLKPGEPCKEAFKIIASKDALDFSFLPVPENRIYSGARAGEIERVSKVLDKADGWSDVVLGYWVSEECK